LERLPARSIKWAVLLLALGASAEADAYFRHMAVYGSRQWGHSANMAGAEALLAAEAPGCAVDSAMLELRYPELAYHVRSRAGLGQDAWVLLPPEYRLLAPALGELRLQRSGANDEPVLMLRARGPAARRFDAIDADLRRTLPLPERKEGCLALEERALAQGPHDEWAWWLLQGQSLRHRVELGLPWDPAAIGQWQAHPPLSPGPWVELGRQLQADAPERGMQAYDKALALDPLYAPAFIRRLEALERQGRVAEAEAQRQANQAAQAAGAWTIAE
jgi:tetratricopeptide (TPR) repeat protein